MVSERLGVLLARISGPSMVPTLRHGDVVLARRRAPVRPGDVVLARFRSMPDLLVVKRAEAPSKGGWSVRSDNAFAGGDSRVHGVADVAGRVLLCWRPDTPWRVRRLRSR